MAFSFLYRFCAQRRNPGKSDRKGVWPTTPTRINPDLFFSAGRIAGIPVDVGGMWVGPTQTRLLETIKEYGLHLVAESDKGIVLQERFLFRF